MATAAELNAKLDTIETNVTEIGDDLAEVIAQLPTSGGLSGEEVAALSTRLDGLVARTRTIAEVVPEPEPPPV